MNKTFVRSALILLATLCLLSGLFWFLYRYDNKYTHPQPIGRDGVLTLSAGDLTDPVFLIDGWLLTLNGQQTETYVGQYSTFAEAPGGTSPFGTARYDLTLRYADPPRILTLELPEIFTDYTLMINGRPVAANGSGTMVSFEITDDTHLTLIVQNHSHYHSGLYHPPALGTSADISRIQFIRNLFYTFLFSGSFTLAVFSAILWMRQSDDPVFFHFGILCIYFALSCIHPVLWQFGISNPMCFALESCSRLAVWVEALAIAAHSAKLWNSMHLRPLYHSLEGVVCILFAAIIGIIPHAPQSLALFRVINNCLVLVIWLGLAIITGVGLSSPQPTPSLFSLAGCGALGASLFTSFMNRNLFEPIYTGWQSEWAGFIMILIFEGLCIWHASVLMQENKELTLHLEQTVAQRTAQLESVIHERKNFFSDMAHNLKAPIAAIHGFLTLIQKNSVGVDDELRGYLTLIETKNQEMERRVQSLNTLNAFDRIDQPSTMLDIDELLEQTEELNKPEADAMGINLTVGRLGQKAAIFAQSEKILTLFENLIFNAISVTPMNGTIQIMPSLNENSVIITVADTGCGIPPEKLPHIFERFYVGRSDSSQGSGLGLYISKLTVEELGGTITVQSHVGLGTVFTITLPLSSYRPPESKYF